MAPVATAPGPFRRHPPGDCRHVRPSRPRYLHHRRDRAGRRCHPAAGSQPPQSTGASELHLRVRRHVRGRLGTDQRGRRPDLV